MFVRFSLLRALFLLIIKQKLFFEVISLFLICFSSWIMAVYININYLIFALQFFHITKLIKYNQINCGEQQQSTTIYKHTAAFAVSDDFISREFYRSDTR